MKDTEFTNLFKYLRSNANLTVRDLSEQLNLSPTYLYDLEKGNREPNEKIAQLLISYYNLDSDGQRILYDSIAHSTDSLPFDVIRFLKENPEELSNIISNMQGRNRG